MSTKWTNELIAKEALKYNSKKAFRLGSKTAYEWARARKIVDSVCKHMTGGRFFWTEDLLKAEALKYSNRTDFMKNSSAYQAAHHMGEDVLDRVCSHMTSVFTYWTLESLKLEALKYKTRKEFSNNSSGYNTALARGVMDEICSHMAPSASEPYTLEELRLEALKYNSRGEFQKESRAYTVACKRGLLNSICGHMKPSGGTSVVERELYSLIKSVHKSAKKIRDMKVSIENKPYIHGFEIDIFVPELNKGIEFDGKHHHSFDFLRKDKGKKLWSDDDIRNYHNLKDAWFATKGIKILHVKEEDWIKDKEACIKACIDFLS
jgi:hypothetical protein